MEQWVQSERHKERYIWTRTKAVNGKEKYISNVVSHFRVKISTVPAVLPSSNFLNSCSSEATSSLRTLLTGYAKRTFQAPSQHGRKFSPAEQRSPEIRSSHPRSDSSQNLQQSFHAYLRSGKLLERFFRWNLFHWPRALSSRDYEEVKKALKVIHRKKITYRWQKSFHIQPPHVNMRRYRRLALGKVMCWKR